MTAKNGQISDSVCSLSFFQEFRPLNWRFISRRPMSRVYTKHNPRISFEIPTENMRIQGCNLIKIICFQSTGIFKNYSRDKFAKLWMVCVPTIQRLSIPTHGASETAKNVGLPSFLSGIIFHRTQNHRRANGREARKTNLCHL